MRLARVPLVLALTGLSILGCNRNVHNGLDIRVLRAVPAEDGSLEWKRFHPFVQSLQSGDRIAFEVTSKVDGFLEIQNVDVNGTENKLFPHAEMNDGRNRISAGQTVRVPPLSAAGSFRVLSAEEMDPAKAREILDFYLVAASVAESDELSAREVVRKHGGAAPRVEFVKEDESTHLEDEDGFLHYRLELTVKRRDGGA